MNCSDNLPRHSFVEAQLTADSDVATYLHVEQATELIILDQGLDLFETSVGPCEGLLVWSK